MPAASTTSPKKMALSVLIWTGGYLVLALFPMAVAMIDAPPAGRSFWVEFAVGLGFVGLALMALQFALTARFRPISGPFGIDTMMQFHRQAGIAAFAFVVAHPIIIILADSQYLAFFDPRVNALRTIALTAALIALMLVTALPLWRVPLRIPYELWRLTHGIFAFIIVTVGLAHVIMVGHYTNTLWKQAMWVVIVGSSVYLLFHMRIIRPLVMRRRPWRVIDVKLERERVWTVAMEPIGHEGLHFRAGQFAWVIFDASPFSLRQHPFTIASSADYPLHLKFTIKELGDFTSNIKSIKPGSTAYLDGPYGACTIDQASEAVVLIAGGIGITPMMSILRTCRDRGDKRNFLLMYANNSLAKAVYRNELELMTKAMNLQVVHVPEEPPADWTGESGYLTPEMIAQYIARFKPHRTQYLICGPEPMMDIAEQSLLDQGISMWQIRTERFNIE